MTNSIHDMGGMHGFGSVEAEPNEPLFHAAWEARVRALQRAMGATGVWTLDGFRAAQELLPPLTYLSSSYYARWFRALERQVVRHGLVGEDEITAGRYTLKDMDTGQQDNLTKDEIVAQFVHSDLN